MAGGRIETPGPLCQNRPAMGSRSLRSTTANEVLARRSAAPALVPSSLPSEIAVRLVGLGEAIAYSSALPALVGLAMTWAAGQALASPRLVHDAVLVACGAYLVYGIDRLRDLERDRRGAPGRTAFVERNRSRLAVAAAISGLLLGVLLAAAPGPSVALCLAVGSVGFLHRRLKQQDVGLKVVYVATAWTTACVGLPWVGRGGLEGAAAGELGWSLLFVGSAVMANLIASNLRDGKHGDSGWPPGALLFAARAMTIAAASLAGLAPGAVAQLAWIPAAQAVSLCFFRGSERYGHFAVDGALLVGALIAIVHASAGRWG